MDEAAGTTSVDGCEIAWRMLGSGDPLVVLNGYAATMEDWDPTFLEQLAENHRLLCIDHRGVGGSEPGGEPLSIERMARDVLAVSSDRGIDRGGLLGWSMGGFVGQEAAALAPKPIQRLVLLSTDHGGPDAIERTPETEAAFSDHSGTPREQASRLIGLLFPAEIAKQIDSEFGDVVAEARAKLSPAVLTAQEEAMDRWHSADAEERIAALHMPALVAAGSEDVVIPPENADLLAARLPDAWLARFAAGGHGFMAQEPRRLAGLITAFLADAS
jgi:pimeloyl-ACP methyl ester carboxylesterase